MEPLKSSMEMQNNIHFVVSCSGWQCVCVHVCYQAFQNSRIILVQSLRCPSFISSPLTTRLILISNLDISKPYQNHSNTLIFDGSKLSRSNMRRCIHVSVELGCHLAVRDARAHYFATSKKVLRKIRVNDPGVPCPPAIVLIGRSETAF